MNTCAQFPQEFPFNAIGGFTKQLRVVAGSLFGLSFVCH
jgi:hypothetical protein